MNPDEAARLAAQLRHVDEPPRGCPPPDRIWAAIALELTRKERVAIVDHSVACAACAEAWQMAIALGAAASREPRDTVWRHTAVPARAAALLAAAAVVALMIRATIPERLDRSQLPAAPTVASARISLDDGVGTTTLRDDGTFTSSVVLSPTDEAMIKAALLARRLALPSQIAAVRQNRAPLMGATGTAAFTPLTPVATSVATDRPTFRWLPRPDARSYLVTVTEPAAGYRIAVSSPRLRALEWTAPEPLRRGRTYSWQVVADTPQGEIKTPPPDAGEAKFTILEQQEASALDEARRRYGQHHLALAVLCAEAGLLDDAEEHFRALVAANPSSAVVRELLEQLRRARGLTR